jgi:hypothetical protein
MKTLVLLVCILSSAVALGQAAGASTLSSQPVVRWAPSHAEHAAQKPMAQLQTLLGDRNYTSAHGERPLWEVAPSTVEPPLGDTARLLKKQRATTKKSKVVWEN